MDKVAAQKLRPWEGRKLRRMKRQLANAVNCRHARIILLSRGGLRNRQIGERCGCTPAWVRQIIHRFNAGGIEAITWYPYYCARAGPTKFLADVTEQIAEVALSPPKELIGMSVWSLAKLREYLVAQGIVASISLEWLRQILRRRKLRWRHTKSWKESTDPEFWPKYKRIRRLYAKRPAGGRRISLDEFGPLNLLPRHGKHYARSGHVDRLRATYRRTGGVRHMFGAYDLERDTLMGRFAQKKNWTTFLAFLKWLRRRHRSGEVLHIILDNAGYHLKAQVLNYTATHRIKFYFTPTGASWLNRIECHFTAMKKFALDNTDYRSHQDQQAAIERYLTWRNGARDISICSWRSHCRRQRRVA
ncbi:MAG: IS630 family transposase [Phycisphaerae bacterium]